MTVKQVGRNASTYMGLSGDTKPAADVGATFYETDTGDTYIYDGSWHELPASGGAIPDPLELGAAVFADYVAVGDTPAESGAVRLSYGGFIVERNEGDNVDIRIIGIDEEDGIVNIDPDLEGVVIGDNADGSRIEIGDTPNNLFLYFRGRSLAGAGAATAAGVIQFQTHKWDGGNLANSNQIVPYWDGDNATIILALQNDTADFAFGTDGALYDPFRASAGSLGKVGHLWANIFAALPTANPNVAGQFWNDSGTVKVSAG